ncbi:nitroreductase family deazaflavin-dependent oxidoreductase [Catenuloplanes japonicus]|uniref:nitroreductase family deazaflavin-dependent oxidoreductase n=1 Tax=Catenuloplanes japonicus TaxID=33876 RepID=UPI0005269699|nr:nitroreductase family deazaflavin-dependent oxidoreductase [Catenuloplanes japonicus]
MATKTPPYWLMSWLWKAHRAVLSVSGGRMGLAEPAPDSRKIGMLQLHTVGRKTGKPRAVVLNYIEDGANVVTIASNGGAPQDPAWWLNLQARPDATATFVGGRRPVRARAATGDERERLMAAFRTYAIYEDVDVHLAARGRDTALVVLEPRP